MRVLGFEKGMVDEFSMVYEGAMNSDNPLSFKTARVMARVHDKLEAIATPTKDGFILSDFGGTVILEDGEYDLLVECLKAVNWRVGRARLVAKVFEWLESAPKGDPHSSGSGIAGGLLREEAKAG